MVNRSMFICFFFFFFLTNDTYRNQINWSNHNVWSDYKWTANFQNIPAFIQVSPQLPPPDASFSLLELCIKRAAFVAALFAESETDEGGHRRPEKFPRTLREEISPCFLEVFALLFISCPSPFSTFPEAVSLRDEEFKLASSSKTLAIAKGTIDKRTQRRDSRCGTGPSRGSRSWKQISKKKVNIY